MVIIMHEQLMGRLGALGVTDEQLGETFFPEGFFSALDSALSRGRERLLNDLSLDEVPEGLRQTLLDLASGYFLRDLCARYDREDGALKSLTEGDVSLSYQGGSTGREQLCALYKALLRPDPAALAPFRRICF